MAGASPGDGYTEWHWLGPSEGIHTSTPNSSQRILPSVSSVTRRGLQVQVLVNTPRSTKNLGKVIAIRPVLKRQ